MGKLAYPTLTLSQLYNMTLDQYASMVLDPSLISNRVFAVASQAVTLPMRQTVRTGIAGQGLVTGIRQTVVCSRPVQDVKTSGVRQGVGNE